MDDYFHRPDELEDVCMYNYASRYEKVCKKWKQIKEAEDGTGGDEEQQTKKLQTYAFLDDHKGKEFSHLKETKFMVIPILSLPEGMVCPIEELELDKDELSQITLEKRNNYSKEALTMFLPFRSKDDLQLEEPDGLENNEPSYWSKFVKKSKSGGKL